MNNKIAEKYLNTTMTPLAALEFVMYKDGLDFWDGLTVVTNFFNLSVKDTDDLTNEYDAKCTGQI